MFDKEALKEQLEIVMSQKITYVIGYCCYGMDKAYCLCKIIDGKMEVILQKAVIEKIIESEKSEFDIEVENLSKYFNAKILKEI